MNIDATLAERGTRYGEYPQHAEITQALKAVMNATANWRRLTAHQKETLEMIAHKIGRILNGDPNYHDSWHDIVGYAKLTADEILAAEKRATSATSFTFGSGTLGTAAVSAPGAMAAMAKMDVMTKLQEADPKLGRTGS